MDNIRQRRDEAGEKEAAIYWRPAAAQAIKHERHHREEGDGIAIKVLRPGIVIADEIELKKRRRRPDDDGREDGGIAFRKIFLLWFHHVSGAARPLSDFKESSAGLQSINVSR